MQPKGVFGSAEEGVWLLVSCFEPSSSFPTFRPGIPVHASSKRLSSDAGAEVGLYKPHQQSR